FDMPLTIKVFAQRTHQPRGLKIAGGYKHASSADDNRRNRPKCKANAERAIQRDTPAPAQFPGDRIHLQHQVRRRDPCAEKIHPAGDKEQNKQFAVSAASEWNYILHLLLAVDLFWRNQLRFGDLESVTAVRGTEKTRLISFVTRRPYL